MSMRYPGGLIATSPVNAAYPSGVWTPSQSIPYQQQNVWTRDQYWPYTTLLLNGNGTNGAQNNTFLDSSTNNFTITRNGNTTQGSFTPYEANGYWSNYFDGSGDWLTVTNTGNYATAFGTGDFTVEFWIYPTTSFGSFVNIYDARGTDDNAVMIRILSGNITYYSFGADHISATAPSINTWSHVALSRVSGSSRLYVNGVQVGSTYSDTLNYGNESVIAIGGRNNDGANAYQGYISNVRVVNGGGLYSGSTISVPTTPLTTSVSSGTVRLLTCQANRFMDSSASALAITVNGNTAVQSFQPFPGATTWSASVLGGSGYFDGTGDYLTTSTTQIIPTGSFTVECWAYVTGSGTNQKFVSQGSSGSAGRFSMGIEGGNWFTQLAGDLIQTGTPVRNQWNYVAVTYNGSTITMYVNGTSIGTVASSANAQNSALTIGQDWNTYITTGYIADVRISNTVRTISVPTAPYTSDGNTRFLASFTNAGIFDNAQMNNLETVGNAQVSTSVVKYGTGSMYFDGTGDYLIGASTPNMSFGSGDFTFEAWIYRSSTDSSQTIFQKGRVADNNFEFAVYLSGTSGGSVEVFYSTAGTSSTSVLTSVATVSLNTWTHIAVTRSGSTWRVFIGGTLDSSATASVTLYTGTGLVSVGANPAAATPYTGYIDDLRITKGAARYISNFTPPVARLPPQ